jgi:hypothetical protein
MFVMIRDNTYDGGWDLWKTVVFPGGPVFSWGPGDHRYKFRMVSNLDEVFTSYLSDPKDNHTFTPRSLFTNSTLLRCDVRNTSLTVNFNYTQGSQVITTSRNTETFTEVYSSKYWRWDSFWLSSWGDSANSSGCFLSDPSWNGTFDDFTRYNGTDPSPTCTLDLTALHTVAYQGIMDAFNFFVLGNLRYWDDIFSSQSRIAQTVLSDTDEMLALLGSLDAATQPMSEPSLLRQTPSQGKYKDTIECVFRNYTIKPAG